MVAPSIKLITAQPIVINTGNILYVSCPIINVGQDIAPNILINKISLGIVPRLSPQVFPLYLGNLSSFNTSTVDVQFNAINLIPDQKYLLNVAGVCGEKSAPIGFSVNRYITIPAKTAYPVELLKARMDIKLEPMTWNYTIFNDEPKDSQLYISAISLAIASSITVTGTPSGWNVDTDDLTYVNWYSEDISKPYSSHIRPGNSLNGFQIKSAVTADSESTACFLISWKNIADEPGLGIPVYAVTPRRS